MPELPEVESLRRGLEKFVKGQKVLNVEVLMPKLVAGKGTKRQPDDAKTNMFVSGIKNQTIDRIDRRAKNLMFVFESGGLLLVHLKMSGQLVYKPNNSTELVAGGHPINLHTGPLPGKHTHIIFYLENGTLYYNDTRQFGYLLYHKNLAEIEENKHFDGLGLEPFGSEFSLKNFVLSLDKKKNGILKKVFLDQAVVVGLGNIYADEVCFDAKVLPNRTISSLDDTEKEAIYTSICKILPKAIELGGSSISKYLLADGSRGNYAREHKVYGRGNKPCLVCGATLTKIDIAGRTTVYCSNCQK